MKKRILLIVLITTLSFIIIVQYKKKQQVYSYVNARIIELEEKDMIRVEAEGLVLWLNCSNVPENRFIYVNYNASNEIKYIAFSDLKVGDDIIVGCYGVEEAKEYETLEVDFIQLSTQRLLG